MPPDLEVIKGQYFRDLLDQPRAIAATVEALAISPALTEIVAQARANRFPRIVLTGMGTSFHALHPLQIKLIESGFDAAMEETSELVHYKRRLLDRGPLIIAVSQSGHSAEIVHLLDITAGRCTVIGVTNTPSSPLALRAAGIVMTKAGEEFSVSCKTYVVTLAALHWLSEALAGGHLEHARAQLAGAVRPVSQYLDGWEHHVNELLAMFADVENLFLTGRGPSLAAVGTGALTIKESDRFAAEGMGSAAFRHGPFEIVGPRTFVIVFAGTDSTRVLNARLVRDVRDCGGVAELISQDSESGVFRIPSQPAAALPIFEILPVQMITLALGARARREPGKFTVLSKVTTVE